MRAANNQSKSWSLYALCMLSPMWEDDEDEDRTREIIQHTTLLLCRCHQNVVLHCIVLYCMALCYYCSAYIANMCLCKTIWCSDDEDRTQRIILNQPRQGLREQNRLLFVSTIICYLYHLLFTICINCQGISNHAQLISCQRCKWCFVLSQRVRGVQDTQNYQSYLHFFNNKFLFDPSSSECALLTQIGLTQK